MNMQFLTRPVCLCALLLAGSQTVTAYRTGPSHSGKRCAWRGYKGQVANGTGFVTANQRGSEYSVNTGLAASRC